MIPVVCRVKHDPENGTYGDCVRAAVASILELDAEKVPHFYSDNCDGETAVVRMREFLATLGYGPFFSHFDGCENRDEIMQHIAENCAGHYLLFGSTLGGDHVVVCKGTEIVHDPNWLPSTLRAGGSNGFWSVMVIAKL